MTYLPFIVALVIYIGVIVNNVISLATHKRNPLRQKTLCAGNAVKRSYINSYISSIIMCLIVIILTYILCVNGKEKFAWFVVILPFIICFISFLILANSVSNMKSSVDAIVKSSQC